MSPNANIFHIRSATSSSNDTQFILEAWDSTLPYLASIGAGEMWGSEPFSRREGSQEEIMDIITNSEKYPQKDTRRLLVVEVEVPNEGIFAVGAAMIRDALPDYLMQREELSPVIGKSKSLLFIEVLVSDLRSGHRIKGAGTALVEAIKSRAVKKGKDAVFVDAWAGNERKLNRYYEGLGFRNVGDFFLQRRSGSTWPGTLYCIDLKDGRN